MSLGGNQIKLISSSLYFEESSEGNSVTESRTLNLDPGQSYSNTISLDKKGFSPKLCRLGIIAQYIYFINSSLDIFA